jgi:hypothetical protein
LLDKMPEDGFGQAGTGFNKNITANLDNNAPRRGQGGTGCCGIW